MILYIDCIDNCPFSEVLSRVDRARCQASSHPTRRCRSGVALSGNALRQRIRITITPPLFSPKHFVNAVASHGRDLRS